MHTVFRPKRTKFLEPVIPERIRRIRQICDAHGHKYRNNLTEDKWELLASIYKQKFPDHVVRELKTVLRVKVPKGQFELDEKGTIDELGAEKEALVYGFQERVMDPQNPDTNILTSCSTKMGVYTRPFFTEIRDDLGNVIDSTIHHQKTMFYIPFSEEAVHDVLKEFNYGYRGLGLAIAIQGSADPWYGRDTYRVWNLEEFCKEEFDDILEANRHGYLKEDLEGQVQKYIKDKQEKREKARAEVTQFKKLQQQKQNNMKKIKRASEDSNDTT